MTMTINDYVLRLKELLGIPVEDISKDPQLTFTIEIVIQAVLTWCNISVIPIELELVVLQIAEDQYRTKYAAEFSDATSAVQSVKRGDVTTTFSSVKPNIKAGPGASFVQAYESQLAAFRKLRW
ncbi:hypothetical protein [Paenibacillus anseongense]|uniref:hypothetical protein n=1 Tax=Paenibacillus anseongense TaxID=2682845 RepID=UPI002DC0290C|nr:hypothetical protein [Paenibacillus anseongense]MEC0269407.1 hypothetical protein [Paenibacillus anseongense]